MSKSFDRRAFLRLGFGRRKKTPAPQTGFDLVGFYRQRQILGLASAELPPVVRRTETDVPVTRVGSPDIER